MSPRGLYIHVPLCASKCSYCDFYSVCYTPEREAQYVVALLREMELKATLWGGDISSLYVGGGSPSSLSLEGMSAILEGVARHFHWPLGIEATFEVNPQHGGIEYWRALQSHGINRLSIGLQSANNTHLQRLGRTHSLADFETLCNDVTAVGFGSFSVDSLYGFPGQTVEDHLATLKYIAETGASHISAYALQLEPNTPLYSLVESGVLSLPTEDETVAMMLAGRELLLEAGFTHYELSNFARLGHESRHNNVYWRNEEYLGLGPAAASYIDKRRFTNSADLRAYARCLAEERLPVDACETTHSQLEMGETMMLGLRMLDEGVNVARYTQRFGCDPRQQFAGAIAKFVALGMLEVTPTAIRLTDKGFPVANQVQMEFLP